MNKIKPVPFQRFALALGCALAVASCGGGGGGDTAGSGGSGTGAGAATTGSASAASTPAASTPTATASTVTAVTTGPITGFGSVIINGTRYDDSAAKVTLDDDSAGLSADLRLGMMVQVESVRNTDGTNVRATSVAARSYLQGPVTAVGTNQLTVLGVTVTVTPTTVFDNVTGLGTLAANDRVEIYGIPGTAGTLTATRIEKTGNTEAKLIGTVQNASATSFTLGGITVQYLPAALIGLPAVTNGATVRVRGNVVNATTISATAVRSANLTAPAANGQAAEVEGVITGFTDPTHFSVNGVSVVVGSGVAVQGTPALGARVEITGTFTNGALTATKVEVRNQDRVDLEADELHGAIGNIDPTARTFTLRNGTVTVKWDNSTAFDASLPNAGTSLAANLQVEVKGHVVGSVLLASRIKLDK